MNLDKKYKCIFFDLDHTLWDYETNASEALRELYDTHQLADRGCADFSFFNEGFIRINNELWDKFDRGEIHKDFIRTERFHLVLKNSGIDDYILSRNFSLDYLNESPKKKNLVPHAREILEYLHARYELYIITNGFEEIQTVKMASGGITSYFKGVVTSARAGHKKPSKEIFEFALRENGHLADQSIMVGDNLMTDIAGARNASIDGVFYNPNKITHTEKITYEISSLRELLNFL